MIYKLLPLIAVSLTGCNAANVKDVLSNLDKDCVRHYAGSLSSGTAGIGAAGTVTFTIDCQPAKPPTP